MTILPKTGKQVQLSKRDVAWNHMRAKSSVPPNNEMAKPRKCVKTEEIGEPSQKSKLAEKSGDRESA